MGIYVDNTLFIFEYMHLWINATQIKGFLAGAFLKEKKPTITVASFFRQTTEHILYVPFFSIETNRFRGIPVVAGSDPCSSQTLFRPFTMEINGSTFRFLRHR